MAGGHLRDSPSSEAALLPLRRPQERPAEPRRSDVDEWGRSESTRAALRRVYGPLYRHWFRAEWEGMEKIPVAGGALLVANHAGALPTDAPTIMHGVEEQLGRPVYGLADYIFRSLPFVGTAWARGGGVAAHPDNAYRLLREQQQLALVFPEGTKGTGKLYRERYQLRRFGRGGFVEIAMRAGVPVVPVVVVGSEETMPMLAKSNLLARVLGVPYVPFTANMAVLGPLGILAPFPAKLKLRVLDPVYFEVPADQERYPRSRVFEEAEAIRQTMQRNIYEMLRQRRSVWFG